MTIRLRYPKCNKTFSVKDDYAGKKAMCPCGVRLTVPFAAKHQTIKKQTPATKQLEEESGKQSSSCDKAHIPKFEETSPCPFTDIQNKFTPQKKKERNKRKFITFEGRIGRAKFALSYFCLYPLLHVPSVVVFGIVLGIIEALMVDNTGIVTTYRESPLLEFLYVFFIISFVVSLVFTNLWFIGLCWQRLHDIDKSGWHLLLIFVPIINFVIVVLMFIRKGTDGPNQYGPPPS